MASQVALLEDALPLIVCVLPAVLSPATVDEMASGFERVFARGERYALISCSGRGAASMLAKERRAIADWANRPRVREMSGKLCIGGATVVEGAVQRAAITAILWFWTPPFPHEVAATPTAAVDFCFERMKASGLSCPVPAGHVARKIAEHTR